MRLNNYRSSERGENVLKKVEKFDAGKAKKIGIASRSESILFFEKEIVGSHWLTTNEAAEYLRTSPNQIRNWVYLGKIRAYKLFGKSLRFKSSELDLLHKGGQAWE